MEGSPHIYISVWLGSQDTVIRKMFRCIACGRTVNEVNGEVIQIIKGDVQPELSSRAVIVQCRECKTRYCFYD